MVNISKYIKRRNMSALLEHLKEAKSLITGAEKYIKIAEMDGVSQYMIRQLVCVVELFVIQAKKQIRMAEFYIND